MGRTVASDPLQKSKFKVTIPGMPTGIGFQKASGLSSEVEVATYDESGYDCQHKIAGTKQKVGDITLERGVYVSDDLLDAYKRTLTDKEYRNTITISQCDKAGEVVKTYTLAEAFVSKWEGTDFDATSGDIGIEKITISFEKFL